jgi:hypothetical protein
MVHPFGAGFAAVENRRRGSSFLRNARRERTFIRLGERSRTPVNAAPLLLFPEAPEVFRRYPEVDWVGFYTFRGVSG